MRATGEPVLLPGAVVSVDETTDDDFSEVAVSWNCHSRLWDCFSRACRLDQWDDPAFRHYGELQRPMLAAMIRDSGFG
ncbi:hypothetical protein ABTZ03_10380 [Kitasatospora sp. NPDC096077]|uniref:hypothetical protein n=1 Tax=Kitasatospora sp. NPDC096077 TaxID=3155544 RepID=UPI00331EC7D7